MFDTRLLFLTSTVKQYYKGSIFMKRIQRVSILSCKSNVFNLIFVVSGNTLVGNHEFIDPGKLLLYYSPQTSSKVWLSG